MQFNASATAAAAKQLQCDASATAAAAKQLQCDASATAAAAGARVTVAAATALTILTAAATVAAAEAAEATDAAVRVASDNFFAARDAEDAARDTAFEDYDDTLPLLAAVNAAIKEYEANAPSFTQPEKLSASFAIDRLESKYDTARAKYDRATDFTIAKVFAHRTAFATLEAAADTRRTVRPATAAADAAAADADQLLLNVTALLVAAELRLNETVAAADAAALPV